MSFYNKSLSLSLSLSLYIYIYIYIYTLVLKLSVAIKISCMYTIKQQISSYVNKLHSYIYFCETCYISGPSTYYVDFLGLCMQLNTT